MRSYDALTDAEKAKALALVKRRIAETMSLDIFNDTTLKNSLDAKITEMAQDEVASAYYPEPTERVIYLSSA
jgi:hypothetical protein